MKKALSRISGVLILSGMLYVLLVGIFGNSYEFNTISCVSDAAAVKAVKMAGFNMADEYGLEMEDMRMQIVYQLARRSVVRVAVKESAGSGIIWKIDNGIVIVSNRHLLMKDVRAEVVFCNKETADAEILGYSQQYDIGFIRIPGEAAANQILRDVYEAVPVFYETDSEDARSEFASQYADTKVLQIGLGDSRTMEFSTGVIKELRFVPLFNTHVLETACFSKAGMSGGGVFDEGGRLVGMISGGEVPEDSQKKEAELTYSIPPSLIEAEYNAIMSR
ncbi:MAG: trypsin-like peptidase domain-containing protein [Lachnospiraceae bacterium]|nr:trypsin-like peptidase domain-containing protein [Lachnospiraceae bacterium]